MKTVEMDVYAKLRKELKDLHRENDELRERNADLERRLTDLHGEYMLLRYQFKGLPNPNEFLKMKQEMQTLKKELRNRGWKDLM
jgi:predicted  nucleic acid-binding Zn-ribbon protein